MNLSSVLTLGDFCRTGKYDVFNPERRVSHVSVTRDRDNILEGRQIRLWLYVDTEVEVGARYSINFPEGTVLVVGEKPC